MKRFLFTCLLAFPLLATAQVAKRTTLFGTRPQKENVDKKYLKGAVPEVNGHVTFTKTIQCPGLSQADITLRATNFLQQLSNEPCQLSNQCRMDKEGIAQGQVAAAYTEWMEFRKTALCWDRTQFKYRIMIDCKDGECTAVINRITYEYGEDENSEKNKTYEAEEWINDQYGLNKSQTNLSKLSGKFRKKTIDRVDDILQKLAQRLK